MVMLLTTNKKSRPKPCVDRTYSLCLSLISPVKQHENIGTSLLPLPQSPRATGGRRDTRCCSTTNGELLSLPLLLPLLVALICRVADSLSETQLLT
ncbi:hypothetical protein BDV12DRAFT_176086 [Aspergillus spectabilis]